MCLPVYLLVSSWPSPQLSVVRRDLQCTQVERVVEEIQATSELRAGIA